MNEENKIKEIEGKLTDIYLNREPYWSVKVKEALKELSTFIREKTIEELKTNKDYCPTCGADLPK